MWCLGQTSAVLHEPNQYDRYTESAFHGAWSPSKSQESFYRHGTLVWSPAHISLLREVVLISLGGHTVSLLGPLSPSDQERTLWVNAGRGTLSRRIHMITSGFLLFWGWLDPERDSRLRQEKGTDTDKEAGCGGPETGEDMSECKQQISRGH